MWTAYLPCRFAVLVAAVMPLAGSPLRAEDPSSLTLATLQPADPCGFFRNQAFGKGLSHYTTEMLWACEAIAARHGASMPLGARLHAVDVALHRYRAALVAAARATGVRPPALGLHDDEKRALAETTGALAALVEIQGGF